MRAAKIDARSSSVPAMALGLALFAVGCRGRDLVGETTQLDGVAAVHAAADGSAVVLGHFEGVMRRDSLFTRRARIARVRERAAAQLLYDGEGQIIDASWPTERAGFALVRVIRPGTPDVVRQFALLVSMDGGASWQARPAPAQESLAYVELTDERHGWLLGYLGAFETTDAGVSWTPVVAPPRAELTKNLVASGGEQGAIVFEEGRLEWRDQHLALVRSVALEAGTVIQCLAGVSARRLLVITATDVPGSRSKRAGAREIDATSLAQTQVVEGLPEDFVCRSAAGGHGRAFVAGGLVGTGSMLGLSHEAFRFREGTRSLERVPAGGLADAVVGLGGAPLAAWPEVGAHSVRVERWR